MHIDKRTLTLALSSWQKYCRNHKYLASSGDGKRKQTINTTGQKDTPITACAKKTLRKTAQLMANNLLLSKQDALSDGNIEGLPGCGVQQIHGDCAVSLSQVEFFQRWSLPGVLHLAVILFWNLLQPWIFLNANKTPANLTYVLYTQDLAQVCYLSHPNVLHATVWHTCWVLFLKPKEQSATASVHSTCLLMSCCHISTGVSPHRNV